MLSVAFYIGVLSVIMPNVVMLKNGMINVAAPSANWHNINVLQEQQFCHYAAPCLC